MLPDKEMYSPVPSEQDEHEAFLNTRRVKAKRPVSKALGWTYLAVLHVVVVVLIAFATWSYGQGGLLLASEMPFAKDFIEYEEITFAPSGFGKDGEPVTPYEGERNGLNDDLWHDLTTVGMYAVNQDEYAQLNITTAEIPWLPGHRIVMIEVFHQLHCLNYLRRRIYEENGEHFSAIESDRSREIHVSHCIDYLRQVLMCKADLTPIAMYTGPEKFMPDFAIKHTCRKWERIRDFALQGNTTQTSLEG